MPASRTCDAQRRRLSTSCWKRGRSSLAEISSRDVGQKPCAERGRRPYSVRAEIFPPRAGPDPSERDRVIAPCDRRTDRTLQRELSVRLAVSALAASTSRKAPNRARIPGRLHRSKAGLAQAPQKTLRGKDRAGEWQDRDSIFLPVWLSLPCDLSCSLWFSWRHASARERSPALSIAPVKHLLYAAPWRVWLRGESFRAARSSARAGPPVLAGGFQPRTYRGSAAPSRYDRAWPAKASRLPAHAPQVLLGGRPFGSF